MYYFTCKTQPDGVLVEKKLWLLHAALSGVVVVVVVVVMVVVVVIVVVVGVVVVVS